ncbi:unnamed protein product [Chondrus crispus]|uniref:Phospholipid scramblase n=1 Tax=Chondrus crispus TaxID=2769 RepID=R7QB55_CHOCR|nr:unnamed protein product [Chondrus crispus]CDF34651.1 unnamed protein product [Chondrus crispus]|eukprot:XP_005714470.1 unnamed protein product [Chondrus crispus]
MFLVSSSVHVETPEGERIGEVNMNWHMWRRRYSLYVQKEQFAEVNSGFLAVDFDMRDMDGKKMASVNKDFTGFARELFTDARQYVLRMDPSYGLSHDANLVNDANTINLGQEEYSDTKMGQRERAVVLAAALAIDFGMFLSKKSSGWLDVQAALSLIVEVRLIDTNCLLPPCLFFFSACARMVALS